MPTSAIPPFGQWLCELRTKQNLSQERLAELSGVSARTISSLEAGDTTRPQQGTIRRLADALKLDELGRQEFETAAGGRVAATGSLSAALTTATRVLPRDTAAFTGREEELKRLAKAASTPRAPGIVPVFSIDGMPGVGKTAFAVHAAHRLAYLFPDRPVFLSLAGHVPERGPVHPADALAALLLATGMSAKMIPPSLDKRVEVWRSWLADKRLLLLLDDAVEAAQVEPMLPGGGDSMVLITSRGRLIGLTDARALPLDVLRPDQAAELLAQQAGRPGLTMSDDGIAEISRLCGYLPVAVNIMGRLLHHYPASSPADFAQDLSNKQARLDLLEIENQSVAAVFDLSYRRLRVGPQRMFRRLALNPGVDIDAYAAAALDGGRPSQARRYLAELYAEHLLTETVHGRYRMHDLIREYAGSLAEYEDADPDRDQAAGRVLDYFQRAAEAADRRLSAFTRPPRRPADPAGGAAMPDMPAARAALVWLRAERASLLACVAVAVSQQEWMRAADLTAGISSLLRIDGPWADAIAHHDAAARAARTGGSPLREADALHDLGMVLRMSGDYPASVTQLRAALDLYQEHDDALGAGNTLASLATTHRLSGQLAAADEAARQALAACRDAGDWRGQVRGLTELGTIGVQAGRLAEAMAVLQEALAVAQSVGDERAQAAVLVHIGEQDRLRGNYAASAGALRDVLRIWQREGTDRLEEANALTHLAMAQQLLGEWADSVTALEGALAIYRDFGDTLGEGNALTFLGPALFETEAAEAAFDCLSRAERILRDIGSKMGEGNALCLLGRLYRRSGLYPEAEQALDQALKVYNSIPLPGGTTVVYNEFGLLRRLQDRLDEAESMHRQALELAQQSDSEGDKADALRGLGLCARDSGRREEARDLLTRAREI